MSDRKQHARARRIGLRLSALAATALPAGAHAHDAPLIQRIVWRPEKSDVLLQTNRGLIFGDPASKRWRLLCNEALHIPSSERPGLAYLPSGRIVVGTSSGVQRSDDDGCTWQSTFPQLLIPALAQDPQQPARIYVSTFPIGMASENVSGDSALRVSDDGGESFRDLLLLPDDDYANGLAVAPSEPERVYASGGVYRPAGREFYVARSDDAGATWQRFEVELEADDFDLRVLAVSPVDPDVVIAKIAPGEPLNTPERVLISRNGGETFTQVASLLTLRDAAFSADGTSVWLAGKDGLLRSDDGGDSFEPAGAAAELSCAVEHDGALHACGKYDGLMTDGTRNGVGRSTDDGDSYEPWMTFQDVRDQVTCDASSPATATCAKPWADWQYEVSNMFSPASLMRDGGTPPAMPDASTTPDAGATTTLDASMPSETPDAAPQSPKHDDSGCNASGTTSSASWLVALLLLLRRKK